MFGEQTFARLRTGLTLGDKLQAMTHDILPLTTAITDYAIGLEKLSDNGQSFAVVQMAVNL